MVVIVLQATEVQVTVVNTRIMVDKELTSEVIILLGMGPLSLTVGGPRHSFLRSFGVEITNL